MVCQGGERLGDKSSAASTVRRSAFEGELLQHLLAQVLTQRSDRRHQLANSRDASGLPPEKFPQQIPKRRSIGCTDTQPATGPVQITFEPNRAQGPRPASVQAPGVTVAIQHIRQSAHQLPLLPVPLREAVRRDVVPRSLQLEEPGDAPRCLHRVIRTHPGLGQGILRMKARTQLPARPECLHQLRHRQADGRLRVADPQTLPALGPKVRHESPYPLLRHFVPSKLWTRTVDHRRHSLLEAKGPAQCARGAREGHERRVP